MNKTLALSGLLALGILSSCKKEEEVKVDLGYAYYPTTVGSWVEYQVDSMWRDDDAGIMDSVSYMMRQTIESAYIDLEGRPAWRVHRSVQDSAGAWKLRDVWSTTTNGIVAELTEENVRLQKLSFPVRLGRAWDMNVLNTDPELEVEYEEVDSPWSVNGLSFDSTAYVRQTVQANFVLRRDLEERYAKHVGMVYKKRVETETQSGRVRGWWLTMTAIAFGTN